MFYLFFFYKTFVLSGKSFEENVFEMYKSPSSGKLNVGQLLTVTETVVMITGNFLSIVISCSD